MKNNTNSIWLRIIHPRPTLAIRKKGENNNLSDQDTDDDEYTARYIKIVKDMKKVRIIFPRFLLMMSADEDKSLPRLSTFAIQKGIEGLVGEPENFMEI